MEVFLHPDYPGDAAFGCDYFSRSQKGQITEEGPDGPVVRDEVILVTDADVEYEGRVCFGERTARHFAHTFGMVDGWRVDRLREDHQAVRDELEQASRELAKAREQIEFLQALDREPAPTRLVALDGTSHTSLRAACEATAKLLGVEPKVVLDAVPVNVPQEVGR